MVEWTRETGDYNRHRATIAGKVVVIERDRYGIADTEWACSVDGDGFRYIRADTFDEATREAERIARLEAP